MSRAGIVEFFVYLYFFGKKKWGKNFLIEEFKTKNLKREEFLREGNFQE
jgi:hypothetical protein